MERGMHVFLQGVILFGRVGVLPQEQKVGHEYRIDLSVRVEVTPGMETDSIEGTVSYADLYTELSDEFSRPAATLEYVALKVSERIVRKWPEVLGGEITIVKTAPPIPGMQGSAGVTFRF